MLRVFKKCEKSIDKLYGVKEIVDFENYDEPFLMCISSQDSIDKSVFGLIKEGARAARVRTSDEIAAGFKIDEMPIDFLGIKNIVGSFYQPNKVIIDIDTLKTLPKRELYAGLAEAFKMALCFDKELAALILRDPNIIDNIDKVIVSSINIKKKVVEEDTYESGLRKVLNYGHTVGHAIEAIESPKILHGEAVALGMLYASSKEVCKLINLFIAKYSLPKPKELDKQKIMEFIRHDKKSSQDRIDFVYLNSATNFEIKNITLKELEDRL
jgi:3-dehydroquinate synthase